MLNIIVAFSENNIIGINNNLPWYFKEDLDYFKSNTTSSKNNVLIMGYNTYLSLNNKILKNRICIVIDKNNNNKSLNKIILENEKTYFVNDLDNIIDELKLNNFIDIIWIIGGEKIYYQTIQRYDIDYLYVTKINYIYNYNLNDNVKYFPYFHEYYDLISYNKPFTNHDKLTFYIYKRKSQETQYIDLLKKTLNIGKFKNDRTQTNILSFAGSQSRYSLFNQFPLLTTKKMFFKGIVEELLWFLRGETNAKILKNKGVKIWDKNSSKEYLNSIGLINNEEGDCGPIYGFNFRYFGAKYIDCNTDYTGQGFDQLIDVINKLKNDANSRRIIINLWNPNDLDKVCLPPCHVLYQFIVYDNKLTCSMYQRSGDLGLGVPFNIASASLLTYIIGFLTNLIPYELVHTIGDNHIYLNHIDILKEQINKKPYKFPTLKINNRNQNNVENFILDDFKLNDYKSHEILKMEMS